MKAGKRRGSVFWAAAYLYLSIAYTWRALMLWSDPNQWVRTGVALIAVAALTCLLDEIRAIVRTEIVRARADRAAELRDAFKSGPLFPDHPVTR
jgi:protein-S-isoprenylcysteine O-methyltransferase Ste14